MASEGNGLLSLFRALRHRNFRLFFSGQSISLIGTWMQRVAMMWLVYGMTDSEYMVGLIAFWGQFPSFLAAPFTGVLSDRWSKYRILLGSQIAAMVQAVVLFLIVALGVVQIWHLFVLAVVLSVINAFDMPSRQALTVELVGGREDLGNAIALNSSMVNLARIVGPALAGILIALTGEAVCFLVNALTYIAVITSLMFIRLAPSGPRPVHKPILRDIREGFSYAFGFPPIRAVVLLFGVMSFAGMSYAVLVPVFAKEVLAGTSKTYGFLMAGSGLGALTGALYLASRRGIFELGKKIPLAAGIFGVGLMCISFTRLFALSFACMVASGFGMLILMASSNTFLQTISDDDKRGRVMSFFVMAFMGMAPLGSLAAGAAAEYIGAPPTLLLCGSICIVAACVFYLRLETLRGFVRPVYAAKGLIPAEPPNPDPGLPG